MSTDIYSIIKEKFRFFFKKISWRKNLTFLFFLILAIIFWVMQIYSQKIVFKLSIPIKYKNVSEEILFEHNLPEKVEVDIKDLGSSILKYATKSDDSITIDLGIIIKQSPDKNIIQSQELEQLIRAELLPNSELISFYPNYISYAYNKVSVRKIPVIFDGHIQLSAGYQLDGDVSIFPDTIIAYGSKAALDELHYAYTSKDTILDVKGNQAIDIELKTVKGIDFKPQKVRIDIPVDKFLIKEVKVAIECLNLPDDLDIIFFPSEVTVPFFVGLKRYNLIESNDFKIQVDYKDIQDLHTSSIPIRIIEAPDFVRTQLPEPSEVEFILEQKQ